MYLGLLSHLYEAICLVCREKIEQQIDRLKALKSLRANISTAQKRIKSWGTERNSYPCDRHRTFDEDCALCLKKFRTFAIDLLLNLE